MRWTLGSRTCLLGLTAFFFTACGQNEGGRCQINSDCGSGLECINGQTGNGTCQYPATATTSDAALTSDLGADMPVASDPEVDAEAEVIPATDGTEIDTTENDAGAVLDGTESDVTAIDAGAVDSDGFDSTFL
jgi:hypothetical protein